MTRSIVATTRATTDDGPCDGCGQPFQPGQRIILVRDTDGHHRWLHVRHLAEHSTTQTELSR